MRGQSGAAQWHIFCFRACMRHVLSCLVVGAALSFGCDASSSSPSGMLPLTTTLQVGEQTTASGLSVTFAAVKQDSRCPIDAFCVRAGDATLVFDLSANRRAARYDLQVPSPDKGQVTYEGFLIEVQELTPYPSSGKTIRQDEYRATVKISR
jgi:hypothetical protein